MNIIQIGTCKSNDDFLDFIRKQKIITNLILVEPMNIHNQDIINSFDGFPYTIENSAIVDDDSKEISFYYHKDDGPRFEVASVLRSHILKHGYPDNEDLIELKVNCLTVNELFDKYNLTEIDYLFIDAEGLDEKIIKSIDFSKYKIKNIYFEIIHMDLNSTLEFLSMNGYDNQTNVGSNNWDCLSTKYEINNINHSIHGNILLVEHTFAGQTPTIVKPLSKIIRDFDTIIEIGYYWGGFTLWLHNNKSDDCKLISYDIDDSNRDVFNNIDFRNKDCFNRDTIEEILNLIKNGGKTLVFCDGGYIEKEFTIFSTLLKPGDVILAHDYYDDEQPDPYNSFKESEGWIYGYESKYSNLKESIKISKLEKYHYEEFRKCLVGSFIKKED